MKYFKKHLLIFISLSFILFSCKKEEPVPDTEIVLTVVDIEGEVLSQTDVYLFETEEDFRTYISAPDNAKPDNYVQTGITDSKGVYTFCCLSSIEYFFFADNKGLKLSNVIEDEPRNYKLGGTLTSRASTYVQITLEEYERREIKFFSQDPSITGNQISVFLSTNTNTSLYTISEVGEDEVTNIYLPREDGTYTFYIRNEEGCVWTKEVIIDDVNQVENIELESCGETTYSFYYPEVLTGDITIYLNNEITPIGTITEQGTCTTNQIVVTRPTGVYTYRAEHSNGTCTWIGETTGSCIGLEECD